MEMNVKKNRQTGREPTITVPFYPSVGFDAVGGAIDWLVEEGFWDCSGGKKEGGTGTIQATEFKVKLPREQLVGHIEEKGLEKELDLLVAEKWEELDALCRVSRKRRYE